MRRSVVASTRKRSHLAGIVLCTCFILFNSINARPAGPEITNQPLTLQILHGSDFQAGIAAIDDAPRLSSVINGLKSEFPTNTLILATGNNFVPGVFFNASADSSLPFGGVKGRADIEILNALGIQASSFGNDEFDAGPANLRAQLLADSSISYPGANFPYLSANLDFSAESNLADLVVSEGQNAAANTIAKSVVLSVAGQKIGLVGGTDPGLLSITVAGKTIVATNVVDQIQRSIDALLLQGINKIIVMTHLNDVELEIQTAGLLRGADIVIGGSEGIFAKPSDRLQPGDVSVKNYPTIVSSISGDPVYVVNVSSFYRYIGRLIVNFDQDGRVVQVDERSGAYAADAQGVIATGNFPPNSTVSNIANNIGVIIDRKDGLRFGRTTQYLNGNDAAIQSQETNLGDLSADANLFVAHKTDPTTAIAFKNSGGFRDSIGATLGAGSQAKFVPPLADPRTGKEAGEVSQLDIENSLRFNNSLILITLSAQHLRDAIEWSAANIGMTPFLQVGGVSFSFNPTNAPMTYLRNSSGVPLSIDFPGERLRNLVVWKADGSEDLVVEEGTLAGDPNRTFRIVAVDYLANGGDDYLPLTFQTDRVELVPSGTQTDFTTPGVEQNALAGYLQSIHTYNSPDLPANQDLRIQNLAVRSDEVLSPVIRSLSTSPSGVQITLPTLSGRHYELESKDDITASWQNIGSSADGNGSIVSLSDTRNQNAQRYYRVVLTRQ